MRLARSVFAAAGLYGLAVVPPQYFLEGRIGRDFPPMITHPEYFYGFVGVALAWQAAFFVIAADPARHRLMMLPAILEKLGFGLAAAVLYAQGRATGMTAVFGGIDIGLAALFAAAFWSLRPASGRPA